MLKFELDSYAITVGLLRALVPFGRRKHLDIPENDPRMVYGSGLTRHESLHAPVEIAGPLLPDGSFEGLISGSPPAPSSSKIRQPQFGAKSPKKTYRTHTGTKSIKRSVQGTARSSRPEVSGKHHHC